MRGATQCARRLKRLFRSLRTRLGKVGRPSAGDPTTQLILGILSRDMPEARAREALDRLRAMVVDYNELRVIAALELAEALGDYPDVRLKCEDISRALNSIFAREHTVSLERLADLPKKELRAFLDQTEGLDGYTRARVQLLGFQRHAVPLDEAMWAYARHVAIVDGRCALEEAQGFLERQIAEKDALEFVALLKKAAWAEMGSLVRKGEVERIRSVPPDRTTSHMLQVVSQASASGSAAQPAASPTARAKERPKAGVAAQSSAPLADQARGAGRRRTSAKRKKEPSPKRKPPTKAGRKTKPRTKRKTQAKRSAGKPRGRKGVAGTRSSKQSRRIRQRQARTKSA